MFTKNINWAEKLVSLSALILLASGILIIQGSALASNGFTAYGSDTTAGSPTYLKIKPLTPNQQINFVVEKPSGVLLILSAVAGQDGVATTELYDYHTKVAGKYMLSAVTPGSISTGSLNKSSFNVLAGETDSTKSSISLDRAIIKSDGQDLAKLKVVLVDKYDNPIQNRSVKLIPSRSEDVLVKDVELTNSSGEALFYAASKLSGVGTFSALDMTTNSILKDRASISFNSGGDYVADAGGDFVKTANAAVAGPLAGFDISGFPATVKPNENVTFKVKSVDASNLTVQDYTGTIRFSAEGDNADGVTLPANYKFLAEDLGEHSFNLGISFNKAGIYQVNVNDLTDKFKKGSATVVVAASGSTGVVSSANKPIISAPSPGSYSQAQQTISGTAKSSSAINIYDNSQKIGSVPVGPLGKFSFQTGNLADGEHSIYVVNINNITDEVIGNSEPVLIKIDTTPPKIDQLILDPTTGVKGGDVIKVKVYSESKLSQAAVTFNFDIVQLVASIDDESVYEGTIKAPKEPGSYALNVLIVDELRNEGNYTDQAKINVDEKGATIENSVTQPVVTPVEVVKDPGEIVPVVGAPSQVNGLIAYGSDKKITLVWDAATDDKQVKQYKIYYGFDVKDLKEFVMTKDASSTWYIPGLENGKEYFFAVTAFDNDGNESSVKSEIVSAIPFMLEINNALSTKPTQTIASTDLRGAAYNGPFPPSSTQTGPEIGLLFLGSAAVSAVLKLKKKKK